MNDQMPAIYSDPGMREYLDALLEVVGLKDNPVIGFELSVPGPHECVTLTVKLQVTQGQSAELGRLLGRKEGASEFAEGAKTANEVRNSFGQPSVGNLTAAFLPSKSE